MRQRWLIVVLALVVVGAGVITRRGGAPDYAAASAYAGPLAGKKIVVDPGHNGGNASHPTEINRLVPAGGGRMKACNTTGTETNDGKLTEAAFNWAVAGQLRSRLVALGATVTLTRLSNQGVGPCINRRAAIGNAIPADAVISIHGDGGPSTGRGFDVIRPGGVAGQSRSLIATSALYARRVRSALVKKGYRTANYVGSAGIDTRTDLGGLNLSKVPVVLVELGNMRNAADAALMKSGVQRGRMADALAAAVTVQVTH